ncbi:hypothetical protein ACSU6B_28635 [Neobacillus sp. C211]|uniref:hypothetical protein n=1 Tax=unclassified Neobacillus TaxID=2675272 RepID=UPI00397A83E9
MKAYLLESLKRILWFLGAAFLGVLVASLRKGGFIFTPDNLFFFKAILIGFLIVEIIKLFSWLINQKRNH